MNKIKQILRKIPWAPLLWHSRLIQLLRYNVSSVVLKIASHARAVKYRKTVRLMITGTKGKTTTTIMVAKIMEESGHVVGYCTTDNVVVDGSVVRVGDSAGQMGARPVLEAQSVTCAVMETARGNLAEMGLYIATCHAAALLNVGWDHVGTDGIDTREAMLAIKRRVTDASRGRVVLNAEDPLVETLASDYGVRRVTFFAMDPAAVARHLAAGAEAITLTEGANPCIVHRGPASDVEILPISKIPASIGGTVPFIVANALAATALARAANVPPEAIAKALRRFDNGGNALPGRFITLDGYPFTVVMDRGHDVSSLEGFFSGLTGLRTPGCRVNVMLTAVGNRPDWTFERMAAIAAAAGVENYVCYDSEILRRNRVVGEVPRLLHTGLIANNVRAERIAEIPDVRQAVQRMITDARHGDILCFLGEHPRQNLEGIVVEELCRAGYRPHGASAPPPS